MPEDYIHRIGRTARAGQEGKAVSLVSADEHKLLSDIERLLKQEIPRKIIQGFEPTQNLRSAPPKPISRNKGKGRTQRSFKSSGKTKPSRSKAAWHQKRPKKKFSNK